MCTVVGTAAAVLAFLPVKQAIAIEKADGDALARYAYHFGERSFLLMYKAQ